MFKRSKLHIKIYKNRVDATNLRTGKSISAQAVRSFSSNRLLVSDFFCFTETLVKCTNPLNPKVWRFFNPPLEMFMQAMEMYDGGLGTVEIMSLKDAAEHIGALKVIVRDGSENYSKNQILELLKKK
jgi:hypothetical protein